MLYRIVIAVMFAVLQYTAYGEPFTYQGQLGDNGAPANGMFDMEFTLLLNSDNSVISGPFNLLMPVSEGLFLAELDFGDDAFSVGPCSLQIKIRPEGDQGAYTELLPWVEIQAAPQSQYSLSTRGIFVSPSGDVGIGTTTPEARLEIVETQTKRSALVATVDHADNEESAISGVNNGDGPGGGFLITNGTNSSSALSATTNGTGRAGIFRVNNLTNTQVALQSVTGGLGSAAFFQQTNALNNAPVIRAETLGTGSVALFESTNNFPTLVSTNAGLGVVAEFHTTNTITGTSTLWAHTDGLGIAGQFQNMNPANDAPVLYAGGNGTGPAALFGGNVHAESAIKQRYTPGTFTNATPIAYATVLGDGTVASGTPNISVVLFNFGITWNYEITVTGETLNTSDYTTIVTPTAGFHPVAASISSAGAGKLRVVLTELEIFPSGDPNFHETAGNFNILIFKGD
jgi:hypothetical protein